MSEILKESRKEAKELYALGLISEADYHKMVKLTAKDVKIPIPGVYNCQQIIELRQQLNCSQAVFAEIAGVTAGTVSKWERGVNQPDKIFCRFFRILEKYGMNALS